MQNDVTQKGIKILSDVKYKVKEPESSAAVELDF